VKAEASGCPTPAHLLEASVHNLQLLTREFRVLAERIEALWLVAHHLQLKVIQVMVCNINGKGKLKKVKSTVKKGSKER
jgi:hypothetical protein